MRCKPSYSTSLTPKSVLQLFTISLREIAGRGRQLELGRLRGAASSAMPGLVSKRARRQSSLYFLMSQRRMRGLVIGSTAGHQKGLYVAYHARSRGQRGGASYQR